MNPPRKSILMLCSWYPNRVQATNGNFVEKHVRLVATDHKVQVLQVEYDPELAHQQTAWETDSKDHYQLMTVYFGCRGGRLQRLLTRMKLFNKAFLKLRHAGNSFNLIHVHVAMPAVFVARYWHHRYGIPFVLSSHSSGFLTISPKQYPWWQRWLLAKASNAARIVMPVSQALADAWKHNGLQAPIEVIPNVVDTDLFFPATSYPTRPPLRLLHISNFHPQAKNVEGILRVAQRLIAQGFPFQLTIAGDGDLAPLQAYAKQLELNAKQVHLRGPLTESEVAETMRAHHLFLLFSNYETQGVTLLEAQCCGLPVMGTQVGGIPEIIDKKWKGILVEAGDEAALLKVIIEQANRLLISAEAGKISEAARLRYGTEVVKEQLNRLYA